jgi:nicotinate-nucleotide pyrophosphorylase (carboxylating)
MKPPEIPLWLRDRLSQQIRWEHIDETAIAALIRMALAEDFEGWGLLESPAVKGDPASRLLEREALQTQPILVCREPIVVAGLPLIPLILETASAKAHFSAEMSDGMKCPAGTVLGSFSGSPQAIIEVERILLNFLQHLSGIATLTAGYVSAMGDTRTRLLDTRKTTPGYRVLEKYAVVCGGGYNHRMGLYDRLMLKDNHLAAAAATSGTALAQLVERARRQSPDLLVEVEVDHLEQIEPVITAGAHCLLLDNFSGKDLRKAIKRVNGRAAIEASGGITLKDLPEMAQLGLDFISTGATVHQATWKDIGLDWRPS